LVSLLTFLTCVNACAIAAFATAGPQDGRCLHVRAGAIAIHAGIVQRTMMRRVARPVHPTRHGPVEYIGSSGRRRGACVRRSCKNVIE
jgi:hypothetical protein